MSVVVDYTGKKTDSLFLTFKMNVKKRMILFNLLEKRLCKWLLYKLTNLLKSTLFSSWYTEADVYS